MILNLSTGDTTPWQINIPPIVSGPPPVVRVDFWSRVLQRWVGLTTVPAPATPGLLQLTFDQVAWLTQCVQAGWPVPALLRQLGV